MGRKKKDKKKDTVDFSTVSFQVYLGDLDPVTPNPEKEVVRAC